jgi:hypothetical protein
MGSVCGAKRENAAASTPTKVIKAKKEKELFEYRTYED